MIDEIERNEGFVLFSPSSLRFVYLSFFLPLETRNASKSPVSNTRLLLPRPTQSRPTSRTELLSLELWPPDPTISENDKDDSPPKMGEDRMPPKMRKRWMHREIGAMKEAVAGDREIVLEHPGMVGLGICLEKGPDRLRMFFFFTICALGLM